MIIEINTQNYKHVDAITLWWKEYKSRYDYNYYYDSYQWALILEEFDDDAVWSYTLITNDGEKFLGYAYGDDWGFDEFKIIRMNIEACMLVDRKNKEFNRCKDLFNKWLLTGRDEFLQKLKPLMQD